LDHSRLTLPLLAATLALGANTARADASVDRATTLVRAHRDALHAAIADRFQARGVVVDADGTEHVRFDRTYAGLPVIGGDVVVHARGGRLRAVSQTQAAVLALDTHPTLPASEALVVAGTRFGADFDGHPAPTLAVYVRGPGAARLAWQVRLANAGDDITYIVDARDGRVLEQWSRRPTAASAGTARTLYSGQVAITTNSLATGGYELRDPFRGGATTLDASNSRTSGQVYTDADNLWGDHTATDKATAAVDAQYGAMVTWDYFRTAHGRTGIRGDGVAARSRVHYGLRYSNAYWNDGCFCMTYGDGDGVNVGPLVALDIAGHEMSHGVNAATANLIYSGESGGLNEANSDILGTLVEFHAGNTSDTPDYLIGEEIFLANVSGSASQRGLRYMFKPSLDGRSPNCWSPGIGSLDVHYSSGVANLFFYLLAEGTGAKAYSGVDHTPATCNGAQLAGIGRGKAGRIWYRALTVYFTSSTNSAGARAATIAAAKDLYGPTSPEQSAVAAAWNAVNVH
jgi:Zn-dependent metalloprotease